MSGLRALLYLALGGSALLFSVYAVRDARRRGPSPDDPDTTRVPGPLHLGVGFVTDFLDTLGIGSFAPTTSLFRFFRLVPDQLIPGTLMIGHLLPSVLETFIYVTIIEVDILTMVLLIAASVLGSYLGARRVARLDRRAVQLGMGAALLLAATVMLVRQLSMVPEGAGLIGLSGVRLGIGLAGNFALGALMTIGVGAYAPSLILFGLLGMNERAIFPIMMGSCALIMPAGGIEFVRERSYSQRAALGLTLGGIPGVLLAAFVVKQLPLATLRWLVLGVVVYTALAMLHAGLKEKGRRRDDVPETATKGDR